MSLLDNVKEQCRKKDIRVSELEKAAGLAENTIYKWQRTSPSVDKVKRVAVRLGITVDELLEERR